MDRFQRYAIYALPHPAPWVEYATRWLGWDAVTGCDVTAPEGFGFDPAAYVTTPRRYGLHATIKPPFRLASGKSAKELRDAVSDLVCALTPVQLDGLELAKLGRFYALRPLGDEAALNALAAKVVVDLDGFRAPPSDAELARRRGKGLRPELEANLLKWGYPHVMDAFRFHITLTNRLDKAGLRTVGAALEAGLVPLLPAPFRVDSIALVGEFENDGQSGQFRLIERFALT